MSRAAAAIPLIHELASVGRRSLDARQARAADSAPDAERRRQFGVRPGADLVVARSADAMAALTTPAALLTTLIQRMGGAETSSARGAFVNLRV